MKGYFTSLRRPSCGMMIYLAKILANFREVAELSEYSTAQVAMNVPDDLLNVPDDLLKLR